MLATHLDAATDLASRAPHTIAATADWIDTELNLRGKAVCDLGCGPGLYAIQFADKGANVVGMDWSSVALAHAKSTVGGRSIHYTKCNYLTDDLPASDIFTLIYCDLCALSAAQRKTLLNKVAARLAPGGTLVLDVFTERAFDSVVEQVWAGPDLMGGFWSADPYFCLKRSFRYDSEAVSLDRYLVATAEGQFNIYNWLQHFTREKLEQELSVAGLQISSQAADLTGKPTTDSDHTIGVIATKT